jgi:2-hydroxy-6-oxonona-2,4-dienedioate hydrolase
MSTSTTREVAVSVKSEQMMAEAVAGSEEVRIQRYRGAERDLLDHYGLAPTERFVELQEPAARLRVLEFGSGEPILFVHGTAGAGPVWAPLVRKLSGFRCLVLDRPGWGLSTPIAYPQDDYRGVVDRLLSGALDALGVDRAHVVGGSIGEIWALGLAKLHPDRVANVVLMGGSPLVNAIDVPKFIKLFASPIGALMVRLPMKEERVRSIVSANGDRASLEAGRLDEFIKWRVSLGRDTDSMRNEREMVRSIVDWRRGSFRSGLTFTDEELAAIEHPTLFVYGTEDPVGSVDIWRHVAELMPKGEIHTVEGAGHIPWFHDADGVAARVRAFIERS